VKPSSYPREFGPLISLNGTRSRTPGEIRLHCHNLTPGVALSADASAAEQLRR
jgi:hypothetical protein